MHANERVLAGQKRALELALHGRPLAEILDAIVRTVEEQSENHVLGSILLLDESGQHLLHGAAPSLPEPYCKAIDGIAIGPDVGSCGTAAFHKKTVVVRDIASDPLWKNFKSLALEHNLRACWSMPIVSTAGEVLGTFALYHHTATEPTARDIEIVELMGHTATVIIERDRSAQRQARAESMLQTFIDNLPSLAWAARADGHIDFFNQRFYEFTGTTPEVIRERRIDAFLDPRESPGIVDRWNHSLAQGQPFQMEFTLRGADGLPRWFLTRVAPSRDSSGNIVRWFGTSTDIHEIKAAMALTEAMADQARETQAALLSLRAAKEAAERRAEELEKKAVS